MVNFMKYFLLMTVFILISDTVLKADEIMYIGVLAPITGELRKEGIDVIRSARIAADQLNSIKGQVNSTKGQVNSTKGQVNSIKGLVDKRIEIIFRNSASSLQVAKPALSDLLENQKCEAIITCDSEMITGMVSDICETREIPFAIVNGFSSDRPFKFSFTEHPSLREIVKTAALWLNKNHEGEKILLVNREKGIGEGFEPLLLDIFDRNQIIKTIRVRKESFAFREVNEFLKKNY
jgi:ABC-type branched-subunit amino acid transport system substrate-binding protein